MFERSLFLFDFESDVNFPIRIQVMYVNGIYKNTCFDNENTFVYLNNSPSEHDPVFASKRKENIES